MSFATAALTGTYKMWDGVTPAQGTVEIMPNSRVLIDPEGDVILSGRVKIKLGHEAAEGEAGADADGWVHDGTFSVTLPATDDATVEPATGRQYAVSAKLKHQTIAAVTGIELATGETVDMADVTSAPETAAAISLFLTAEEYDDTVARVTVLEGASTAQQTALDAKLATSQREQSSGVAGLTAAGKLYEVRIPDRLSDASLSATYATAAATRLRNRLMQISLPVTSDVSLFRVAATKYKLSQRLVGQKWFRVDLLSVSTNPGALALHQLNQAAIDMPWLSVAQTDASVVRTGAGWSGPTAQAAAFGGSYHQNNTGTGQDVTWTTPAGVTRVGVRTVAATNGGVIKVEIDGSATAANLLPTAQTLVTQGRLAAAALVAGGGTLNPTDRVLDLYAQASAPTTTIEYDRHFALADGLAAGVHTVKLTVTGYQNALGGGFRLYDSGWTYGTDATTIATANMTMLPHTRLLSEFDSAWEYAHELTAPAGGGAYTFVGNVHGYEAQDSLTLYLDGAAVTLADGARVTGNDLSAVRVSNLRHPGTGATQHAAVTTTYRLGIAGLQVTHETVWATACTLRKSYPAMLPLDGKRFPKGSIGLGADYDLAVNGGLYNGKDKSDSIYAWDSATDGTLAALLHLPDLKASVNDWASSDDIRAAIEDRVPQNVNAGDLSKMYTTRVGALSAPVTVANGTRWRSHAIYRFWQQANVNAVLASA